MTASRPRRRPGPPLATLFSLGLPCAAALFGNTTEAQEPKPLETLQTLPSEAFCPALARALCGGTTACTCAEEQVRCIVEILSECSAPDGIMGAQGRAALADGLVIYDGAQAHALVRRLSRRPGCDPPLDALGWTHAAMLRFGGVLNGTVPDGAPCRFPFRVWGINTCATGICRASDGGPPRCVPLADRGDPCGPEVACVDPDLPATHALLGRHGFGDACDADGRCRKPPALETSAPCEASEDCASGLCADIAGSTEAVCQRRERGLGEACVRPDQCALQTCIRGRCTETMCPD